LYLVKNGYARTYIIEPNVKYSKDFIDAEKYAKSQKIGIWE
ncbi:MAG: thermonuclease family protein, partial [Candidatus Aenigmarchaeota archaeon]|nr:thermonuclease family protein [Candidatus Aenigmarchaeota archaeon]